VRLWSWQNQDVQLVHTFDRHAGCVRAVAFSPDAKFLASRDDQGVVCLWSVATQNLIYSFSGRQVWIYSIVFSPDGQTLALTEHSQLIQLWSTDSGKLLRELHAGTSAVTSVAFAPNGQILASAGYGHSLNLWSASDGQLIHRFTGLRVTPRMVAFAPNSQMTAAATDDNSVRIWSIASRKLVHVIAGIRFSNTHANSNLVFSRRGDILATGTADGTIQQRLIPHEASNSIRVGNCRTKRVPDLAFSSDQKLLASASADGIRLWAVGTPHMPNLVNELAILAASGATSVTFSQDSAFLVIGAEGGKLYLHQSFQDTTPRSSRSQGIVLNTHTR